MCALVYSYTLWQLFLVRFYVNNIRNKMNSSQFTSGRTSGDGMEFVDPVQSDTSRAIKVAQPLATTAAASMKSTVNRSLPIPGATAIYRDDESSKTVKLPATQPQGKQFYLVPHLVSTKKTFSLKSKEPKFVPFEPYKAAVSIKSVYFHISNGP